MALSWGSQMELPWTVLVILAVLEVVKAADKTLPDITIDELPLTKSLGYSAGKASHNTLDDARINHEYLEQYQEMLKISQETYDTVSGEGQEPRRKDGRRQRHASKVYSPVGRRRARSEALRREKLNSQSLRSHLEHTRHSSHEGHSRESNEY